MISCDSSFAVFRVESGLVGGSELNNAFQIQQAASARCRANYSQYMKVEPQGP